MSQELLAYEVSDRVAVITMNDPRRLNGWTPRMQEAIAEALARAAADDEVGAVVLTGTGPYYSAGVDLSGSLRLGPPRRLREQILKANRALFDRFLSFPKPMLAAVNGHAIGATVTSAALCDRLVAAESATFSTPFARLGLCPEGCSSVMFPKLMGETNATRMLGAEGWKPSATEAASAGLVDEVVADDALRQKAIDTARSWAEAGRERRFRGGLEVAQLSEINGRESDMLADAFLAAPFLMGQYRFLKSRGKWGPALFFLALRAARPIWSRFL